MNKQHYVLVVLNLQPPFITAVFFNKKPMEEKMKQIDETAGRVREIMRAARQVCHISHDEAAALLRIMPNELSEYEYGVSKIPADILERMFVLGYKMMRIRVLESRYRRQRNIFQKIKQAMADVRQ